MRWKSKPRFAGLFLCRREEAIRTKDFGSMDAAVTVVLAALSAQDARLELGRLAEKLAAFRASGAEPRPIRSRRRRTRRPDWVLDAVCRVLADQATGPMRVMSVHAAVEALLGETVSSDSVSWVLSSHSANPSPLFPAHRSASGPTRLRLREPHQHPQLQSHKPNKTVSVKPGPAHTDPRLPRPQTR